MSDLHEFTALTNEQDELFARIETSLSKLVLEKKAPDNINNKKDIRYAIAKLKATTPKLRRRYNLTQRMRASTGNGSKKSLLNP